MLDDAVHFNAPLWRKKQLQHFNAPPPLYICEPINGVFDKDVTTLSCIVNPLIINSVFDKYVTTLSFAS